MASRRRRRWLILAAALAEPVAMKLRGYPLGGKLVVRCHQGHLFTTLWIPGVSVKSLRFLWWRIQRCPVGHHWSLVTPVHESELSRGERRAARKRQDIRLP
jgi:hypothetical protein